MIDLQKYKFTVEHYGEAYCEPNHSFGPGVKTGYLITFIFDGTGTFTIHNVTQYLKKKDAFLISPNVLHHYQADELTPWHYAWISFGVDGFEEDFETMCANQHVRKIHNPDMILHYISSIKRNEILGISLYKSMRDDALIKLFLSELLSDNITILESSKALKIQAVKDYIQTYYFLPLTVEKIAEKFSYNRSYLCRIFKQEEGKSPKQYMIDMKMQIASKMLLESDISVENVSNSIGYQDSFTFSKMFKKRMGVSPQEYKKYMVQTLIQYF